MLESFQETQESVETQELPEVTEQETEQQIEPQEQDIEDVVQEQEEEQEAAFVTVEYDGVEYDVPEALQSAIMKNKDYTTKTQEISQIRRSLEEDRTRFEEERKRDNEDFELQAQVYHLNSQLKTYEGVNWAQLEQDNGPDFANSHWRQYQLLKDQKNDLDAKVTERNQQRSQSAEQALATRLEETKQFAEKNIEGWSPQLASEIEAYAVGLGFTQESLLTNLSPMLLKALNDGFQGHKIRTSAKTKQPVKKVVAPTKTVRAKSGPAARPKDPAQMTMKEYEQWRKAGNG